MHIYLVSLCLTTPPFSKWNNFVLKNKNKFIILNFRLVSSSPKPLGDVTVIMSIFWIQIVVSSPGILKVLVGKLLHGQRPTSYLLLFPVTDRKPADNKTGRKKNNFVDKLNCRGISMSNYWDAFLPLQFYIQSAGWTEAKDACARDLLFRAQMEEKCMYAVLNGSNFWNGP